MVTVRFFTSADGCLHLIAQGHAGWAPKGEDLVCAGVSTLVNSLSEAVLKLYEQGMLRRYPRAQIDAGKAEIIARPKAGFFRETALLYWLTEVGMAMLEENFPECVKVEEAMKVGLAG